MDTRRGTQRQSAEGLHEPRNRKERRQAETAFKRRVTKKYRRKRRQKAIEAVQEVLLGLLAGGVLGWLIFFAPDPEWEYRAQLSQEYAAANEPMVQAINSDHMIPLTQYDQYLQERQAYIDAEQAEEAEFVKTVRQAKTSNEVNEIELLSGTITAEPKTQALSTNDEEVLLRIAMAEAEGEDTEGKALVMRVVMNRAKSSGFPDAIEDVVLEAGQFTPVSNGRYWSVTPNAGCYDALAMIETGWDESDGATYFERTPDGPSWHNTHLQELFMHGGHTFYKEVSGS